MSKVERYCILVYIVVMAIALAVCTPESEDSVVNCDRAAEIWEFRHDYMTAQYTNTPTPAHLTSYTILSLYTEDLYLDPYSEVMATPEDIESCQIVETQ